MHSTFTASIEAWVAPACTIAPWLSVILVVPVYERVAPEPVLVVSII